MRTSARMGQPALKVKGEKQTVGLNVAWDVDRLAVAALEVDCGEVDIRAGHFMADAALEGGKLIDDAAFSDGRNASCGSLLMV